MILFTPASTRLNSLIALDSKCSRTWRLLLRILLKGAKMMSSSVLLVSWKCFGTAFSHLRLMMSRLCSLSLSLGSRLLLPRYCLAGVLALHQGSCS